VSHTGATTSMHNTSFLQHAGLQERDGMTSMHAVFPEDTRRAIFAEDTIAKKVEEQVNSSSQQVKRRPGRAGGQLDVVTCEDTDR
jgi:hypothetical protein